MNKHAYFLILLVFLPWFKTWAQVDTTRTQNLNEVLVNATRASQKSGMAFTTIRKTALEKQNLGQDIPFLLNQLPSVVVSSDAGAGVGYTGIRIRGSDPTRINVSINGIPYNDAESQGVYWVNMPDFASSVSSIQVQRGVGTSTNGAGAFGGTINVNTLQYEKEPFAEFNTSMGSFNTSKLNLLSSTGLINNHFVFDARLSKIKSDGYVDRATSDLSGYYLSAGYYSKENFVRLNAFGGKEQTYQAWNGVPEGLALGNRPLFDEYVARNSLDQTQADEMWKSGRRYNFYQYENEVDNYQQDHLQLISSFKLSPNWRFNPGLHYTYGRGYFEQFKADEALADYGLQNVEIGNETITNTDLVRRKWLDNHFYGTVWSFDYTTDRKLNANIGGAWNSYHGEHYGEIIWAQYASNGHIRHRWYENLGQKTDFNFYTKATYQINEGLNVYGDIQYRSVNMGVNGTADALQGIDFDNNFQFFNPKLGFNYQVGSTQSFYASFARGAKEPSRQDLVDYLNVNQDFCFNCESGVKTEKLNDYELGYRLLKTKTQVEINAYWMDYRDQLVLTGAINNVGEAIRQNVDESYRAGIELQMAQAFTSKFNLAANITFSRNKISTFREVVPAFDGESENEVNDYQNTNIAFSPAIIAGGIFTFKPINNVELALLPKYVGSQYLDNTSNTNRKLADYWVTDFRINWQIPAQFAKNFGLSLLVNNLLNTAYASNGYTYSYLYYGKITENFLYPQAGTNFLAALKIRF